MGTHEQKASKPLFLVRPLPSANEGVVEYLQRLAKLNGFESSAAILELFPVPMQNIIDRGHNALQSVIHGHASPKTLRITCQADRPPDQSLLPCRRFEAARVCPSCLRETDIIDSQWREFLSISCQQHQSLLLDQCPQCSRWIHREHSLYRCKCGLDFRDVDRPASPDWESHFYEIVAPWRAWGHLSCSATIIEKAEIVAARVVRQLINCKHWNGDNWAPQLQASTKPWWLRTTDHQDIEDICAAYKNSGRTAVKDDWCGGHRLNCEWAGYASYLNEMAPLGPGKSWEARAGQWRLDLLEEMLLKDFVAERRKNLMNEKRWHY